MSMQPSLSVSVAPELLWASKRSSNTAELKSGTLVLLQYKTTWTGIIDEWAARFYFELDYEREAVNAVTFKRQMAGLQGITVPDVYMDLSSQEVLTTAWVDGALPLPPLLHSCGVTNQSSPYLRIGALPPWRGRWVCARCHAPGRLLCA